VESYPEPEVKRRLAELVRRAERGERIGITRGERIVGIIEPASAPVSAGGSAHASADAAGGGHG
jgi:antitoxin (DNA-binding transcriptional repressor) of toxin-antitoxin stability system